MIDTTIKICKHTKYNAKFPEKFDWSVHLDSQKIAMLAIGLTIRIQQDLKTPDRNLVAGLRRALNLIAEYEECR